MQYKKHLIKLLIPLSFMCGSSADAAPPPGCYSTNDNPLQCWPVSNADAHFGTLAENLNWYGFMVGNLVWDYKTCRDERSFCINEYDSLVGGYNSNLDLIKRLQNKLRRTIRKCGDNCK